MKLEELLGEELSFLRGCRMNGAVGATAAGTM